MNYNNFMCGSNCFNQINSSCVNKISIPEHLINTEESIKYISFSWSQITIITERGKVITRTNSTEKCVVFESPNSTDPFIIVSSSWKRTYLRTLSGRWFAKADGDQNLKPINFFSSDNASISKIFTGEMHTLELIEGKVYYVQDKIDSTHADALTFSLDPVSIATQITYVACGKEHVLLLTDQKTVCSFGLGSRGQLGHGSTGSEAKPRTIEALEGLTVHRIAAGGWHSMAVSEIGDVYIWGWNESGQLGLIEENHHKSLKRSLDNDSKKPPRKKIKEDMSSTPEISQNEILFKAEPTLLDFPENSTIVQIGCGSRHSAAVTDCGKLYTWGWNDYGQLGLGHFNKKIQPSLVKHMQDYYVQNVICSYWNTLIITKKL